MIIPRRCACDTVGQTAGARQILEQSPTWVSNNIDKQLMKADGGGISNRRGEIPGFLPERGFLDRIIPQQAIMHMTGLPVTKRYLQTKSMHSTRHSLFTEVRLALSLRMYPSHLHLPPAPYVPSFVVLNSTHPNSSGHTLDPSRPYRLSASIRRETIIPSQLSGS